MLPQVPGFEGVGVVESAQAGLRGRIFTGKRVVVLNRDGGNWADYASVPADQVIPVSKSLTDEQAATFFVNPMTAWAMTQEVLQVRKGQWLLQTAAGSVLGRMIVRLGKHLGFRTINIVRNEKDVEPLAKLGADAVVVFDGQSPNDSFAEKVRTIIGDTGVSFAIDPVGGATASGAMKCLAAGGRMLVYGTLSEEPLIFSPRELMQRDASVSGFWLGHFMARQNLLKKLRLVKKITQLIRQDILSTRIAARFSITDISDAICAAESNSGEDGKALLRFGTEQ